MCESLQTNHSILRLQIHPAPTIVGDGRGLGGIVNLGLLFSGPKGAPDRSIKSPTQSEGTWQVSSLADISFKHECWF